MAAAVVPLPNRIKRFALSRLLGAQIDPTASIGLSLVDCASLMMGPGSRIGHFNVMRDLRRVELDAGSSVGNFNWITAAPMFQATAAQDTADGSIELGRESAITSRHYIDCSGGVRIGSYSTIGGVRSTILSHQIDVASGHQSSAVTQIGDFCLVSSNVCVVPGARVADRCVIAMGAVVVGDLATAGALYGGVPARILKQAIGSGRYFSRSHGYVSLDDQ